MAESLATQPERRGGPLGAEVLTEGTRLGRYELLVPVAMGGMARVWAAYLHGRRGFTKLVAIKTILPHLASDPEFERMLIDEARIAAGTRHPNVVETYEFGEESGIVYIAMEWVYGGSLAHVLRGGGKMTPLDPRIAARIVADAAAGLHAAHNLTSDAGVALEVVHRDVSPHNVLISIDGNVKVADFGVAKAIGASHQATEAGQLKGKIAYMAPEQATGMGVDRRSDVFSLGCVLYEATTGKQPFRSEGEQNVMEELVKGSYKVPSKVVPGYPVDLERIVVRALASKPIDRFQTMDAMRGALEEWIAKGGPVVTQSNVAQIVRERIGGEVDKRRETIRAAIAAAERGDAGEAAQRASSVPPPARGTSSGIMPTGRTQRVAPSDPEPAPGAVRPSYTSMREPTPAGAFPPVVQFAPRGASPVQYVLAASVGVFAAASLCACLFWGWKSFQPVAPKPPIVVVAPVATEPAVLAPIPPPTGTAVVAKLPAIVFKVIPDKAVLVVDGAPLPASTRSIPRPAAGTTQTVTVHADGYEDQTLTIDDSAGASVDVWLNGTAAKKPSGRSGGDPAPKASQTLPANPY